MADHIQLAKAYIQLIPSAEGIKGKIGEALGNDPARAGEDAGNSMGAKLVATLKGVITAAGIGAALTKAITEGADLEQSIGGIKTLFQDSYETVRQYADQAYQTAGLSANAYMETVTSFSASLLQSLGGDTAQAAETANMALIDMADNANKMGTDMQDIQNAYQGFAKQNYTMLDNLKLGYGGTKAEMERLLAKAQEITGVEYNIDNLSDVYNAIHVIQGELDITGATADEAATTLSGSFASMKAAFSNVLGSLTLGEDVTSALQGLAGSVTTFLTGNLLPAVWNILSALPGALLTFVQSLAPQLAEGISSLVPQITETGTQLVQSLGAGLASGVPEFLAQALPMLLSFTASLRENFGSLVDAGIDLILNLAQGLIAALPTLIEYVPQIVSNIAGLINDNAPKLLEAGLQLIVMLGQGLIEAIPVIIENLPQIIQAIVDVFTAFNWIDLGKNIIQLLNSGISAMVSAAQSAGQSVFEGVRGIIANLPETLKSLGSQAGAGLADALRGMLGTITSAASAILSGILGALTSMPGKLASMAKEGASKIWQAFTDCDWNSLGGNIIRGIIGGIGAMAGALWEAAQNVAKSALEAIKEFLGIASPSRVMRDEVGRYIPAGLAEGILGNAGAVDDAMGALADDAAMQARLTMALDAGADIQPAASGAGGADVLLAVQSAAAQIVAAVRESGGELVIGDEVIGRAANRWQQRQAVAAGGY